MALVPVASSNRPNGVMKVNSILQGWIGRLDRLASVDLNLYWGHPVPSPALPHLPSIPYLTTEDYRAGRIRCPCCWQLKSQEMDDNVTCYFHACGHVCCAECACRYLFVLMSHRCPVCVAIEATKKLKDRLAKRPLLAQSLQPSKSAPDQHWSLTVRFYRTASETDFDPAKPDVTKEAFLFFTRKHFFDQTELDTYVTALNKTIETKRFIRMRNHYNLFSERDEEVSILEYFLNLNRIKCLDCDRDFGAEEGLRPKLTYKFSFFQNHMQNHRASMCEMCFRDRPLFFWQHDEYHPASVLQHHYTTEHSKCRLCVGGMNGVYGQFFNSPDALIEHCRSEHYFCYICQSNSEFYSTLGFLFEHITNNHFVCPDCPQDADFMVAFATVSDLVLHYGSEAHTDEQEMAREKYFKMLVAKGRNVQYYTEHEGRADLDRLDSLLRKCYREGRLAYELPPLNLMPSWWVPPVLIPVANLVSL